MVFKWIYILGRDFRNPSSKRIQQLLLQSNTYTLDQLETYQLKKLTELVTHAYNYSEYYRKSFDKKKVHPADIKKLSDLEKLPIITKSLLVNHSLYPLTLKYILNLNLKKRLLQKLQELLENPLLFQETNIQTLLTEL